MWSFSVTSATRVWMVRFVHLALHQREADIFQRGHMGKQRQVLKHHCHVAVRRADILASAVTVNDRFAPLSGVLQPKDQLEDRGFAGQRRAEEAKESIVRDFNSSTSSKRFQHVTEGFC